MKYLELLQKRCMIGRAVLFGMCCSLLLIENRAVEAQTSLRFQQIKPLLEKVDLDKVTDSGGNNSKYIAKNMIRYIYDGQKFQEIIASEPNQTVVEKRQFPDRIISSRKIRGKFLRKVWGDYLYITIFTKSGEKVFLIDGNEDCFLMQNQTEQLAIDYDVLDRYTPQMGGYRRVNVIRNITSRKTNLKKWRRTVTQKEQNQCEGVRQ
jgi:hypothetical protein